MCAETANDLNIMTDELSRRSKDIGLKINIDKTKVMCNKFALKNNIKLDDVIFEHVESYIYFGQKLTIDKDQWDEVNRRVQLGWNTFARLNDVFRSNLPICLKRKVMNQCVLPVLTYGSETWTLTNRMATKLKVTQRKMERIMLGITLRDKKRNEWIRNQTRVTYVKQKH